uniref:Uncharacterized protein n=1 Tax=Rhizophora mucronata TaxID=61149 RepID=A0A2P2J867_RHIMU
MVMSRLKSTIKRLRDGHRWHVTSKA